MCKITDYFEVVINKDDFFTLAFIAARGSIVEPTEGCGFIYF